MGDTIDQEVVVTRRSAYRALGGEFGQAARYGFTSRLVVAAVRPDGGLTVTQTVEGARLIDCDPARREAFETALRDVRGAAFEVAVDAGGAVTAVKGVKDPVRIAGGADPAGGQTFRVWSLLDADAWRELAGLTFFQPGRPLKAGDTWARPVRHDWGTLGGWSGQTTYTAAGRRAGRERIDYRHDLVYQPPGGVGGPPVRVLKATFETVAAGGAILYDPARGRVTAAEEVFRVKGRVAVALDTAGADVEMEEVQGFELRVLEPATRSMTAHPPADRHRK